jgi:hypothetical protein
MSLNTDLKGRMRNTNLPILKGIYTLYEGVVNSIHSIDLALKSAGAHTENRGSIKIKIVRDIKNSMIEGVNANIIGFEIIDNGIGFNSENYNSFKTLDSVYKASWGCRGVGRLLWLKMFDRIIIKSTYKENDTIFTRSFDFNISNEIHNEDLTEGIDEACQTSIKLLNIDEKYLKALPRSPEAISRDLLEHCLWYFMREGGAPKITIEDLEETINLDDQYEKLMIESSKTEGFTIKSKYFDVTHVKLNASIENKNRIIYSAADRVVKDESLQGKIPGLFGVLKDKESNKDFSYVCFIKSDYLDEYVNSARLNFEIEEEIDEPTLYNKENITLSEIRNAAINMIAIYLSQYLEEGRQNGIKRLTDFINQKAPRYKPILSRLNDSEKVVDPNMSDKDLELKLHSYFAAFESKLLGEGHDLMIPSEIQDQAEYSRLIDNYLSKVTDLKRSELASYVTHRKIILDLLKQAIKQNPEGKYAKEEIIHKLIMPMQFTSHEIRSVDNNLWLIDERLAFHDFLASDKTLHSMPITDSDSTKEPDLLGLNVYDNPLLVNHGDQVPLASIQVIEIKRPMRNDARSGEDRNPIEQALGYLKRIRSGGVKTYAGRPIPNSKDIPGFCYIICDITPSIQEQCELSNLKITSDKLGYFGYNDNINAYVEVISFDRLLNMATERNKAFFDKLGLPTN